MRRKTYPSHLTNEEWAILEPLIPLAKPGGRTRSVDMREVVKAIFVYPVRWMCVEDDAAPSTESGKRSTITFGSGALIGCGNR